MSELYTVVEPGIFLCGDYLLRSEHACELLNAKSEAIERLKSEVVDLVKRAAELESRLSAIEAAGDEEVDDELIELLCHVGTWTLSTSECDAIRGSANKLADIAKFRRIRLTAAEERVRELERNMELMNGD